MTLPLYDAALRDFHRALRKVEPGDCFVAAEDREPPTTVGVFDDIPMPAFPVRQDDEE